MKPRSVVASLVATVLAVGALAPMAYAQSGADQSPDATGVQEVQAKVVDGAAVEDAFVDEPGVEDPLVEKPVVEETTPEEVVIDDPLIEEPAIEDLKLEEAVVPSDPTDEGAADPESASGPQSEEEAASDADGDDPTVATQFIRTQQ